MVNLSPANLVLSLNNIQMLLCGVIPNTVTSTFQNFLKWNSSGYILVLLSTKHYAKWVWRWQFFDMEKLLLIMHSQGTFHVNNS